MCESCSLLLNLERYCGVVIIIGNFFKILLHVLLALIIPYDYVNYILQLCMNNAIIILLEQLIFTCKFFYREPIKYCVRFTKMYITGPM